MISFIVPAHNEQACLGRTLHTIHESADFVGEPYEIIVVDDASTDATAEIARQNNAWVVTVNHRQIAATRNSGERAANGERLFFVDADTTANPQAVAAALRAMDNGAVGGGAPTWFDEADLPLYIRPFSFLARALPKLVGFSGGAFMFCTREAFQATQGFNERLYWAEEGSFSLRLKREGRFVVLWERVIASARRFRTFSGLNLLSIFGRMVSSPFKLFTQRESVKKIWYDSNREHNSRTTHSLLIKVSNWIVLLILLMAITEPIWSFTPWSLTPLKSPVGKIRFVMGHSSATWGCSSGRS